MRIRFSFLLAFELSPTHVSLSLPCSRYSLLLHISVVLSGRIFIDLELSNLRDRYART